MNEILQCMRVRIKSTGEEDTVFAVRGVDVYLEHCRAFPVPASDLEIIDPPGGVIPEKQST